MAKPLASWLSVPKPAAAPRIRLLCFPYAGGTAAAFRPWADVLPPDLEVNAIQMPGREWRIKEPAFDRVDPLVQELIPVLDPLLDTPIAFFGHSLGAIVAFELARALRAQRQVDVSHLFVSAHGAPQLERTEPAIHDTPDETFLEQLKRLRGTPDEVLANEELMELLLPAIRADFAMAECYEYAHERPLATPISAFGGVEDVLTDRSKLEAWSEQTDGRFKLRMVAGGHFFLSESRDQILRAVFEDLMTVPAP